MRIENYLFASSDSYYLVDVNSKFRKKYATMLLTFQSTDWMSLSSDWKWEILGKKVIVNYLKRLNCQLIDYY